MKGSYNNRRTNITALLGKHDITMAVVQQHNGKNTKVRWLQYDRTMAGWQCDGVVLRCTFAEAMVL